MRSSAGLGFFFLPALWSGATAFSSFSLNSRRTAFRTSLFVNSDGDEAVTKLMNVDISSRRSALSKVAGSVFLPAVSYLVSANAAPAHAAVGRLPELSDTNGVLRGVTIDVADQSQKDSMIEFLTTGFDFKVLRRRQVGSVTETWLGFGPEQLSIPPRFTLPVSSFAEYGGHASINVRYDKDALDALYRKGENAPGNNVAYLQVGVPQYRISQMVKSGGNILDAFGIVDVVSPCGLPVRGIIGIAPDPIMFIALNCKDVTATRTFYEQLGFAEQEYPYARPSKGTGQFEPPQPKKSVYLAQSPTSMGILLLPLDKKKKLTPNPVLRSLDIVYTPSEGSDVTNSGGESLVQDPSGIGISFVSAGNFEKEERATIVKQSA